MTARRWCTCEVAGLLIGIDVGVVQEVLRRQTVTPVPLADASVLGLLNLRGQIVTAVDVRRRLGLPERSGDGEPAHIVIRADGELVALVVDAAGDVIDADDEQFEKIPLTVHRTLRSFLTGAYHLEGAGLMLVLDADRLVSATAD